MNEETGLVRASVTYPFAGDGSRTRLLFGAGLQFLGVVVFAGVAALATTRFEMPLQAAVLAVGLLAYVPLAGYLAATMRELLDDEPAPPGFGDWGTLLRDGRRFAGVVALYAIPVVVLAGIAGALAGQGSTTAALAVQVLAGLYALLALYVLPAALVTTVETGRLAAAWDGETLREAVQDRRYLTGWLGGAAIATVGGAVGGALSLVVVGFAVLFAAQVAAAHALTRGVIVSLDLELGEPPAPPASGYVPGWDDGPKRKQLSQGRLGGSLLPTTPDEDDTTASEDAETPPTPGSPATTSGSSSSDGSGSAEATTSDIEPFDEDGSETDLATGENE